MTATSADRAETPGVQQPAVVGIVAAVIAAAVQMFLTFSIQTASGKIGTGELTLLLVFVGGPMLFLGLLVWRRRTHLKRTRMLFLVIFVLAVLGIAVLVYDYSRTAAVPPEQRAVPLNPVWLPFAQWAVILLVWLTLVIVEGREKRAAKAA